MVELISELRVELVSASPDEKILASMIRTCRGGKDLVSAIDQETVKRIFTHSIGRGHWAALDLVNATFHFLVPRLETLRQARYECGFSMLQESTRAVEQNLVLCPEHFDGMYKNIVKESFSLYQELISSRVRKEDAMLLLPLGTMTRNNVCGSGRAWLQYLCDAEKIGSSVSKSVETKIMEAIKTKWPSLSEYFKDPRGFEFYPSGIDFLQDSNFKHSDPPRILSYNTVPEKETIEKAIEGDESAKTELKMFEAEFLAKMDIATLHEFLRHRTIPKTVEPFTRAATRGKYYKPEKMSEKFDQIVEKMIKTYHNLTTSIDYTDALLVLPHALEVYVHFIIDGWNLLHFSGLRLCSRARPSIRRLAQEIKTQLKEHNLLFANYMRPRGEYLGYCPETSNKKPPMIGNYPCSLCPSLKL